MEWREALWVLQLGRWTQGQRYQQTERPRECARSGQVQIPSVAHRSHQPPLPWIIAFKSASRSASSMPPLLPSGSKSRNEPHQLVNEWRDEGDPTWERLLQLHESLALRSAGLKNSTVCLFHIEFAAFAAPFICGASLIPNRAFE